MRFFIKIIILFATVIIFVFLFFHSSSVLLAPSSKQKLAPEVCYKEHCFSVELVKTESQREKGLMYRTELDKDRGMLFIFDEVGIYPFWMKNTLIPLDIIWISSDNKVVFINQNTQPCKSLICPSVLPTAKAKYVLEINAGVSQEIGLKVGDQLKIPQ